MKAGEIYSKTMPFVWAKLLLGLITVAASAVLFAILFGLGVLMNSSGATVVLVVIWLGATGVIRFVIMQYFGYLVKAGHIAVVTEAVTTGRIPDNQVEYGKQCVKERFATSSVYFGIDKLIGGAVKQIQRVIGKVGDFFSFIPGVKSIAGLAQFFVEISLGYIDECCLGYTFYKNEQGAFKSAADGVVIYAQNWKKLLGSAAKTMAMVVLGLLGITLGLFVILGLLFRVFNWSGWIAFIIALLLAFAIKSAFIDSFILVRTMVAYMEVAPSTVITFDLYDKLCGMSSKFRELWNKGKQEQPGQSPQPAYAGGYEQGQSQNQSQYQGQNYGQSQGRAFCGNCGEELAPGIKFCGKCGAKT
jgi:hypothetical protein